MGEGKLGHLTGIRGKGTGTKDLQGTKGTANLFMGYYGLFFVFFRRNEEGQLQFDMWGTL